MRLPRTARAAARAEVRNADAMAFYLDAAKTCSTIVEARFANVPRPPRAQEPAQADAFVIPERYHDQIMISRDLAIALVERCIEAL